MCELPLPGRVWTHRVLPSTIVGSKDLQELAPSRGAWSKRGVLLHGFHLKKERETDLVLFLPAALMIGILSLCLKRRRAVRRLLGDDWNQVVM